MFGIACSGCSLPGSGRDGKSVCFWFGLKRLSVGIARGSGCSGVTNQDAATPAGPWSIRKSVPLFEGWQTKIRYGAHRVFMVNYSSSALRSPNGRCRISCPNDPVGPDRHGRAFCEITSPPSVQSISSPCPPSISKSFMCC